MFAIYDIQGRRFRDTLENLRKVREIQVSQSIQPGSNLSADETLPIPAVGSGKTRGTAVSSKARKPTGRCVYSTGGSRSTTLTS